MFQISKYLLPTKKLSFSEEKKMENRDTFRNIGDFYQRVCETSFS